MDYETAAAAILKLHTTSLLRHGWPHLGGIWEVDPEYHEIYCDLVKIAKGR